MGEEGFQAISGRLKHMVESFPDGSDGPEVFGFSNWSQMAFDKINFGWGKPMWTVVWGGQCRLFRNLVIFKEFGDGMEAWATLDEDVMGAL